MQVTTSNGFDLEKEVRSLCLNHAIGLEAMCNIRKLVTRAQSEAVKQERLRAQPLVEAAEKITYAPIDHCGDGQGGMEGHDESCPMFKLEQAITAYTQSERNQP